MFRTLHEFLGELERLGELHRVGSGVDPRFEIAAITDRVCKSSGGGKALLFERVRGSGIPVATNLFGSPRRMAAALGIPALEALAARMEELLAPADGEGGLAELAAPFAAGVLKRYLPVAVAAAPCQEIVETVPDLSRYPFLTCWPGDGHPHGAGRFITLPLVITRDPETGCANCGMYRVWIAGARSAGIRWYAGRGGELHGRRYRERGERMPVAVAVGGDPALALAAMMPLPEGVDEMQFAGWLRGAPVEMVQCRTSELRVPAGAELVIEGFMEPGETILDGAFGNYTGFYAPATQVPHLRVSCVTRRVDCVYPATVVGPPPMEDCHLAQAAAMLMLPLFRRRWPEIVDISFPTEWIFHGGAIVSVRSEAAGRAKELMAKLWESELMGASRLIVVVDGETDVRDLSQVAWRIVNLPDWRSDLVVSERERGTPLFPWLGSRLGIDATRCGGGGARPPALAMGEEIRRLIDQRWREYGL
ncbi:UbiD family decarboxylase [Geobacter sp.]|uniref:UbiD family decarboxylase n=1 Tax=Geobacter sp. TaxID=46610 RepID=UPI002601E58A|nr:UbiD family decarboxylase [Geobacter sp.]